MILLIMTTFIWAFSFSLIGDKLTHVDPYLSVVIRTGLSLVFFSPFIMKNFSIKNLKYIFIGAIQLGVMYCFYFNSFRFISVNNILLFTIFTPIYIVAINQIVYEKFSITSTLLVILSVFGAYIIRKTNIDDATLTGFFLVQGANFCFGLGQVLYKKNIPEGTKQATVFPYFYLGAFLISLLAFLVLGDKNKIPTTTSEFITLFYLGIIASGLGYYLWNRGSTQVSVTQLAIMNNLLIPAGIIVNILLWHGNFDITKLIIGSLFIILTSMADIWNNRKIEIRSSGDLT
ncbi:EamA family transporter [Vibrio quintilis]|nr:EamA family transporter [Vibrio quintilis]